MCYPPMGVCRNRHPKTIEGREAQGKRRHMLSRYTIYRRRPANAGPLPNGIRRDTRYRTSHILRPTEDIVEAYLADPTDAAWADSRANTSRYWRTC